LSAILHFLCEYMLGHGMTGPSLDEIRDGCGYQSKSGVHQALRRLEQRGWIDRQPYRHRAVRLTDAAWAACGGGDDDGKK
jgi:SOS-response transcriptional repressor LexA